MAFVVHALSFVLDDALLEDASEDMQARACQVRPLLYLPELYIFRR